VTRTPRNERLTFALMGIGSSPSSRYSDEASIAETPLVSVSIFKLQFAMQDFIATFGVPFLMYAQMSLAWGIVLTGIGQFISYLLDVAEAKTQVR